MPDICHIIVAGNTMEPREMVWSHEGAGRRGNKKCLEVKRMTEFETIITELVVNGGNGRSKALEAVRAARRGQMEQARKLLKESEEAIARAHQFQTTMLQESLNMETGEAKEGVSLLVVHGQDHLMDAMVVRDLVSEMIEMYDLIHQK